MTLQKKLPFKDYTTINCQDAIALSSPDMYRYFVLSLTADRQLKTDTTLKQLADFTGEKESAYKGGQTKGKKKLSLNERFKASGVFKEIISSNGYSNYQPSRNIYVFKKAEKGNYRRVKKEFRDLSLPVKLKGYILQLFCLAEPSSYLITRTTNNISRTLGMANKTVKEYNEILKDKGLLKETKEGFELKLDKYFILDEAKYNKEKKSEEEDEWVDWMEAI